MTPSTASQMFRAIDVIRKKRDGIELSRSEIESLVNAYTKGDIPDYQVSAWLMAVVLKGMSRPETITTGVCGLSRLISYASSCPLISGMQ